MEKGPFSPSRKGIPRGATAPLPAEWRATTKQHDTLGDESSSALSSSLRQLTTLDPNEEERQKLVDSYARRASASTHLSLPLDEKYEELERARVIETPPNAPRLSKTPPRHYVPRKRQLVGETDEEAHHKILASLKIVGDYDIRFDEEDTKEGLVIPSGVPLDVLYATMDYLRGESVKSLIVTAWRHYLSLETTYEDLIRRGSHKYPAVYVAVKERYLHIINGKCGECGATDSSIRTVALLTCGKCKITRYCCKVA